VGYTPWTTSFVNGGFIAVRHGGAFQTYDYAPSPAAEHLVELAQTSGLFFVRGVATLAGDLVLTLHSIAGLEVGQALTILEAESLLEEFGSIDLSRLPAGVSVDVRYTATAVMVDILAIPLLGDMDGSGAVNNNDIGAFVMALADPVGYEATYGLDRDLVGDIDGSGAFNNNDITPFVTLLTTGSYPQAVPEPAALSLLVLGGLAFLRRRSR